MGRDAEDIETSFKIFTCLETAIFIGLCVAYGTKNRYIDIWGSLSIRKLQKILPLCHIIDILMSCNANQFHRTGGSTEQTKSDVIYRWQHLSY